MICERFPNVGVAAPRVDAILCASEDQERALCSAAFRTLGNTRLAVSFGDSNSQFGRSQSVRASQILLSSPRLVGRSRTAAPAGEARRCAMSCGDFNDGMAFLVPASRPGNVSLISAARISSALNILIISRLHLANNSGVSLRTRKTFHKAVKLASPRRISAGTGFPPRGKECPIARGRRGSFDVNQASQKQCD